MTKDGSCVWPSSTIHRIQSHFEVRSVKKLLNNIEVKDTFHGLNVQCDILDYFDNEERFGRPLNMSEMVLPNFMNVDSLQKVIVCDCILFDCCSFFVHEIGELFLSRTSVSRIELDTEILMQASRVVAGCQQDPSQAVSQLFILLSDIGGAGRG